MTINHDDGAGLFPNGDNNPADDLLPLAEANPTNAHSVSVALAPGTYNLWYSEDNGLPAILQTNFATPEPATLTLLGSALVGLGWFGWRRRKTS